MRSGWAVVAACVVVLAGCAGTPAGEPAAGRATGGSGWRELPGTPLTPRSPGIGLWTGREVLLIGGSDGPPCPPGASCAPDPTPLVDGAAVDPATGRWRRIADAPVPVLSARGAVAGGVAYLLVPARPGHAAVALAYDVAADRWRRLSVPFGDAYTLVAAGDTVVAYLGTDEFGSGADYVLDPRASTWRRLAADPLGNGFDRTMAWTGREVVLFDHELVPNPGAERPAVTRAAVLEPATGRWRRLPDSHVLGTGPWLATTGVLVNPTLSGGDGGRAGNWGRTYPYGGRLEPGTGRWSALPAAPGWARHGAGARSAEAAVYVASAGAVLDTTTQTWLRLPDDPGEATERTVVAAGRDLFIVGGVRWHGDDGSLRNDAWLWTG